jgi:tetratricopeptide (TPR) repeat protein
MLDELVLEIIPTNGSQEARLVTARRELLACSQISFNLNELKQEITPAQYGDQLLIALGDPIRQALAKSASGRLRLSIQVDDLNLHQLRWECLIRGTRAPFSRLLHPEKTTIDHRPQTEWPIKILVAISNPTNLREKDLTAVDVAMERREIERSLNPLQGLVDVTFLEAPISLDRVCMALERGVKVLHFLGHGMMNRDTGQVGLFFEREPNRELEIVTQDDLLERLRLLPHIPHLITLAACESASLAYTDGLVGMAPYLLEAGAGAVVAMRDKIGIDVAREFIFHFFRRLATHGVIDVAANEARSYLMDSGGWSWSIPVVYMERGAEQVFTTPPDELEVEPACPGEVLILIPEFTGFEPAHFEVDLQEMLLEKIEQAELKGVRIAWLKNTAFGPGDEAAVRQTAARYGASLVIWGWYDRSRFRACFTLTDYLFAYNKPGKASAGASVRSYFQADSDFAVFVNHKLPRQVDYFVFFTLGQLYYWDGDFQRAADAFSLAITAVDAEEVENKPEGLAYAYFYRGTISAVFHQDRHAAIHDYRQSIILNEKLIEAHFSLGDSLRILGNTLRRDGKDQQAQQAYLEAIRAYGQALLIDKNYVMSYERRGLTYFVIGEYDKAAADYQAALSLAPRAEIHHQLGITQRNLGQMDEARAQMDMAIARAPGVGRYYFSRGRILAGMGDIDQAMDDMETYLCLAPQEDQQRANRVRQWLAERRTSTDATQ